MLFSRLLSRISQWAQSIFRRRFDVESTSIFQRFFDAFSTSNKKRWNIDVEHRNIRIIFQYFFDVDSTSNQVEIAHWVVVSIGFKAPKFNNLYHSIVAEFIIYTYRSSQNSLLFIFVYINFIIPSFYLEFIILLFHSLMCVFTTTRSWIMSANVNYM